MMKRDHKDFCAAVMERKRILIQKRKRRQRLLLSCLPILLCTGILIGWQLTDLRPKGEGEKNVGQPEFFEQEQERVPDDQAFLQSFLENPNGSIQVNLPDGQDLLITDPDQITVLLTFVSENRSAFSVSYNDHSGKEDETAEVYEESSQEKITDEEPSQPVETETEAAKVPPSSETTDASAVNSRHYAIRILAADGKALEFTLSADRHTKLSASLQAMLQNMKGEN